MRDPKPLVDRLRRAIPGLVAVWRWVPDRRGAVHAIIERAAAITGAVSER